MIATPPNRSNVKLRYISPPPTDYPDVVVMPARTEGLEKWEACLVGYFLDKKLPFNYVNNNAFGLWKNMGLKEVRANGEGYMFFLFDNPEACNQVLDGGSWYMSNQLIILKKWKRMMKLTKEPISQIPIWVKFFNVPLEYWDHEGLSRLASKIEVPLFMDILPVLIIYSLNMRMKLWKSELNIKVYHPLVNFARFLDMLPKTV